MAKRALTRNELEALGLSSTEIEEALALQKKKKPPREYKYIVLLTIADAETLSKETGKKFVRATEWKDRRKR